VTDWRAVRDWAASRFTLLLLSRAAPGSPPGFRPPDRLDDVVDIYGQLLVALRAEGVDWMQLDEPTFVADCARCGTAPATWW
jgi:methionine synthase II (cobalamin-independent)